MARSLVFAFVVAAALAVGVAVSCGDTSDGAAEAERKPLKIGLLMSFSGPSADRSEWRERGFQLAIKHVNAAGGVFGLDVETARGDTGTDSETAVAEARRLVETEGVHAIVGPSSSANSLPVAERVTGPSGRGQHQPVRQFAAADERGRQRLLLPPRARGHGARPYPGARDSRARVRQRGRDVPGRRLRAGACGVFQGRVERADQPRGGGARPRLVLERARGDGGGRRAGAGYHSVRAGRRDDGQGIAG